MKRFLAVVVILVACAAPTPVAAPFPYTIEIASPEPTIDIADCSTVICCSDCPDIDVDRVIDEFRTKRINGLTAPKFVKISSLEAGTGWKWFMVDSGSFEHCIDAESELAEHEVQRPPGQDIGQTVEAAGGHELKNSRQVHVEFETQGRAGVRRHHPEHQGDNSYPQCPKVG